MEVRKYSLLLVACVTLISVILILNSASHLQIVERSFRLVDEDNGRRELIKIRQHNTEIRNELTRIVYAWDSALQQNYQQYIKNFSGCEYSNCILQYSDYPDDAMYADIVIVDYYTEKNLELLKRFIKQDTSFHTVWLVYGHESPRYSHNKWKNLFNDFDGAITYTRDALVFHPYGRVSPITDKTEQKIDYAANKTRGAFAYVSNCGSRGYNRLDLMKKLGQYLDVDIFGECTGKAPCGRGDYACEHRLHSQYHFYLSFENSLCKDYITEKFWKVLNGDGYYIPVALGGLTIEDYTTVAPPDSFLHVYNFTTIEKLGRYMKKLTQDHQAFNQYNHWRDSYEIKLDKSNFCNLCKIANFPAKYKVKHSNIADKFNDPLNCKSI